MVECPSVKDDFYQSVNYDRLKNEQLSSYAISNETNLNKIIENQMLTILSKEKSDDRDEQLLIDLYNMYLDDEKRNADGIKPILPVVKKIQAIKSLEDFRNSLNDDEIRTTFPISINLRSNNGFYSVPFCYVNIFFGNNQQNYSDFYEKTLIKIGYDKSEAKRLIQLALEFEKKYSEQPLIDDNVTSLLIASNSYKNLPLKELVENWNISGLVQYGFANPSHFEVFNSMYVEEILK